MNSSAPRLKAKAIALQASRDPKRSPLFHWLRSKHATLAPLLAGRRVDWKPVMAAMQKAGITDYGGGVPTDHTLRRTWRSVRKVVEADSVAPTAKPPRKLQPRDLPPDWRPTPIGAPSQASASVVAPVAASQPGTALVPSSYYTPPRVVGQASFGKITSGPLTPEPDYTGMDDVERKIARAAWSIALRKTG